jgi:O-antigen/teichoic acid export membrane protein
MEDFRRITSKAISFVMDLSIPLMLYFIFFASETIALLSGPAYTKAVLPMQIIMPTIVLIGLTNIMGILVLVPLGRENQVLYSEIIGAIVNLIINSLLIPKMASSGAAIGTVFAEFAVWIAQYAVMADKLGTVYRRVSYWKIFLGCLLASFASLWVKRLEFGVFAALIISAIIFFGVYCLVLAVTKEEIMTDVILPTVKNKIRRR